MVNKTCQYTIAIIRNDFGHYLSLIRKKNPKGLSFPSGHFHEGEITSEQAMLKEVEEKTGLVASKYSLKIVKGIPFSCSKGGSIHDFYIYDISKFSGDIKEEDRISVRFFPKGMMNVFQKKNAIHPIIASVLPSIWKL